MGYILAKDNGDAVSVPRLVINNLHRAEENHVRVALYVLATHSTDARDIAHALNLKSEKEAERALQWWAGAGLLERDAAGAPLPVEPLRQEEINAASLTDPMLSTLFNEIQMSFGKTLSRTDLNKIATLYIRDCFDPEVMMLCASRLSRNAQRRTIGSLERELNGWRKEGVETGEQADSYLKLLDQRETHEAEAADLLGLQTDLLTLQDKRTIRRWYEEYGFDSVMIEEALAQAGEKKELRYVNGILKAWKNRGLTSVQQVRGGGTLSGAETASVRVDRTEHSGHDILEHSHRGFRLKRED